MPGGKTFVDGVNLEDVQQELPADCFFVASLASVAYTHPELLQKAIKEQVDGSLSIELFHRTNMGAFERAAVTVDKLMPLSGTGRPQFARGKVATQLWPA